MSLLEIKNLHQYDNNEILKGIDLKSDSAKSTDHGHDTRQEHAGASFGARESYNATAAPSPSTVKVSVVRLQLSWHFSTRWKFPPSQCVFPALAVKESQVSRRGIGYEMDFLAAAREVKVAMEQPDDEHFGVNGRGGEKAQRDIAGNAGVSSRSSTISGLRHAPSRVTSKA